MLLFLLLIQMHHTEGGKIIPDCVSPTPEYGDTLELTFSLPEGFDTKGLSIHILREAFDKDLTHPEHILDYQWNRTTNKYDVYTKKGYKFLCIQNLTMSVMVQHMNATHAGLYIMETVNPADMRICTLKYKSPAPSANKEKGEGSECGYCTASFVMQAVTLCTIIACIFWKRVCSSNQSRNMRVLKEVATQTTTRAAENDADNPASSSCSVSSELASVSIHRPPERAENDAVNPASSSTTVSSYQASEGPGFPLLLPGHSRGTSRERGFPRERTTHAPML